MLKWIFLLFPVFAKAQAPVVVLSFDDGCVSQYNFVAPLLEQYHFGATFFFCEFPPNYTDTSKYMTWDQLKDLSRRGFEIGNHTGHHKHINGLSAKGLDAELDYIEHKCDSVGIPKPVSFAYPAYVTDSSKLPVLRAHGYMLARAGGDRPYVIGQGDPLLLPSYTIKGDDSAYFYNALAQAGSGKVIIFTIHGVPDQEHPWVTTPPEVFARYLKYLYEHHYRVIAMRELARKEEK